MEPAKRPGFCAMFKYILSRGPPTAPPELEPDEDVHHIHETDGSGAEDGDHDGSDSGYNSDTKVGFEEGLTSTGLTPITDRTEMLPKETVTQPGGNLHKATKTTKKKKPKKAAKKLEKKKSNEDATKPDKKKPNKHRNRRKTKENATMLLGGVSHKTLRGPDTQATPSHNDMEVDSEKLKKRKKRQRHRANKKNREQEEESDKSGDDEDVEDEANEKDDEEFDEEVYEKDPDGTLHTKPYWKIGRNISAESPCDSIDNLHL